MHKDSRRPSSGPHHGHTAQAQCKLRLCSCASSSQQAILESQQGCALVVLQQWSMQCLGSQGAARRHHNRVNVKCIRWQLVALLTAQATIRHEHASRACRGPCSCTHTASSRHSTAHIPPVTEADCVWARLPTPTHRGAGSQVNPSRARLFTNPQSHTPTATCQLLVIKSCWCIKQRPPGRGTMPPMRKLQAIF